MAAVHAVQQNDEREFGGQWIDMGRKNGDVSAAVQGIALDGDEVEAGKFGDLGGEKLTHDSIGLPQRK